MNNPAINQALIELEENLSNIESARNQVNKVAEKSEQLIVAFSKVYDAMTSIDNNFVIDERAIKNQLEESFKFFKSGLSDIVKESDKSVKNLEFSLNSYENRIDKLLSDIVVVTEKKTSEFLLKVDKNFSIRDKQLNEASNKVIESINSVNYIGSINKDLLRSHLNEYLGQFAENLELITKESESRLNKQYSTFEESEKQLIGIIKHTTDATDIQLKEVISSIKEHKEQTQITLDFEIQKIIQSINHANERMTSFENTVNLLESELKEINVKNELSELEKKIDKNQKITLLFLIILIIGLLALAFIK